MAKPTKTAPNSPGAEPSTDSPANKKADVKPIEGGVDITKLTPEQLANLQKQLKARKSENKGNKDERFLVIDGMLREKSADGSFKWTTRDILNRLKDNNLTNLASEDSEEIKKIQARKQHLEKKTDEAGKLVYPANTFGYKASAAFTLTPDRIAAWFTAENVAKLTPDAKAAIRTAVAKQ